MALCLRRQLSFQLGYALVFGILLHLTRISNAKVGACFFKAISLLNYHHTVLMQAHNIFVNENKTFHIRAGPSTSNFDLCLEIDRRNKFRLITKTCSNSTDAQKYLINAKGYIESKLHSNKCLATDTDRALNIHFASCQNGNSTKLLNYRWIFASDETIRPLMDARNAMKLGDRKVLIEGMVVFRTVPTIDADNNRQFHFIDKVGPFICMLFSYDNY